MTYLCMPMALFAFIDYAGWAVLLIFYSFRSARWQIVISQGDCRRAVVMMSRCVCDAIISACAAINTPMELSLYLAHQWQSNIGLLLNPLTAKSHRQMCSN
jgi:hypothetical protein